MKGNKFRKLAVLMLAVCMIMGNVIAAGAAPAGQGETDADVKFKAGKIVDPNPGPGDEDGDEDDDPKPPFEPPIGEESLQLIYAPAVDFGEVEINDTIEDYYAKAQLIANESKGDRYIHHYMKLMDQRGTNAGWTITVTLKEQFKSASTVTPELTGAKVIFEKGVMRTDSDASPSTVAGYGNELVLDPGEEKIIMRAGKDFGAGTWYQDFGTDALTTVEDSEGNKIQENGKDVLYNPNIKLKIPTSTMPDAAAYSSALVWKISNTPD